MDYLDSSLLVAAVSKEIASPDVQLWFATQPAGRLCTSTWAITEVSSALAMKRRAGRINEDERQISLETIDKLIDEILVMHSVQEHHFDMAARIADRIETKLRAGDALHMAVAQSLNARVCTLDRTFAEAGDIVGVRTLFLNLNPSV
ncbi:type II toxin-antitoxin system VapC family toxin [Brevundimonas sp.]|uniref:type II toxin-antitoxin system VapC family toxin n=1 Tax=Brevundimonas sp. TaxID=1871086 RepID=UPI00272F746C|nr:type II toxin-antitoxin system VapC family toxin [Brevundimonas sp.]MDP1913810.1 type II toxin-antitoxin system VapC family toxin [Brevundimonas sp.]